MHDTSAYGLWSLVVLNSLIFICKTILICETRGGCRVSEIGRQVALSAKLGTTGVFRFADVAHIRAT